MNSKITVQHRQKLACVYVRQSSLQQVLHNQQSTERQYALREKAAQLGWPPGNVQVLDGDLGVSGAHTTGREDFKKLVADVLDRVDQFPDFDPRTHYTLTLADVELTAVERQAMGASDVDEIGLDL